MTGVGHTFCVFLEIVGVWEACGREVPTPMGVKIVAGADLTPEQAVSM